MAEHIAPVVLKPYVHDCADCQFVGWVECPNGRAGMGNMYLHDYLNRTTILIRYGDGAHEHTTYSLFKGQKSVAHSCQFLGPRRISDREAMDQIHDCLDGKEWSSDTLEHISHYVTETGRAIREPDTTG